MVPQRRETRASSAGASRARFTGGGGSGGAGTDFGTGLSKFSMALAVTGGGARIAGGRFSGCTGAAAGAASDGAGPAPPSVIQRMTARLPPKRIAMPSSESRTNRRTGSSCHGAGRRSNRQSMGNDWEDEWIHTQRTDQSSVNLDCE